MRVRARQVVAGSVLALGVAAGGVVALLNTDWASRRVAR